MHMSLAPSTQASLVLTMLPSLGLLLSYEHYTLQEFDAYKALAYHSCSRICLGLLGSVVKATVGL